MASTRSPSCNCASTTKNPLPVGGGNTIGPIEGRGHRELPIEAAFVGRSFQTTRQQSIEVGLKETDKIEHVMLVERNP